MRRSLAVVAGAAALATTCGCAVQTTGSGGGAGSPVRVGAGAPAPTATAATRAAASTPPRTPAAPRTSTPPRASATPRASASSAADAKPPSAAPASGSPAPPPPVLWSRGDTGRDVRELQARLRQIAWLSSGPTGAYDAPTEQAVRGFQGRRGLPRTGWTDTVTWERLLGMTRAPEKGELYATAGRPAAAPDPRCLTGRVLCIDKASRTLRWMIDGRTVSTMSVRFGSQYTPTREGVFHVYWKSRHHVSTLYDSPMPYAMFFSGGQAVHYSSDFAARGYAGASHGCVNVRDEAAIAGLFAQVRNGDKVVVSR
ncbi:L,D-transpeptidase family protein [Streptomyces sp. NPDC017936]|uniref:L,D-transpeptidase family protein n=1 Tax=Streptomyces sp. NPDC017936 TaxID=3365016 RepID=UPI003792C997